MVSKHPSHAQDTTGSGVVFGRRFASLETVWPKTTPDPLGPARAAPVWRGAKLTMNGGSSPTYRFLMALFVAISSTATAFAQENLSGWNQFRGPNGSGVAVECRPPVQLGTDCLAWSTDVPPGHSSPVLCQDLLVLTGVVDERLVTVAIQIDSGRIAWQRQAPQVPLERTHEVSGPAASSPCADAEHVFVYFGSFGLLCYDLQGNEVWQRPIPTPKTLYGMSTSPILHQNLLILALDNDANLPDSQLSQSKLVALNKLTGETVWETPRPWHRSGWSTPTIWNHDDGCDLVVLGNGRLCGYDPATGLEKWHVNGFSRETIARPIVGPNFIYGSASMLGGVPDEHPDTGPFWLAVMKFDANGDGKLQRDEMTQHFTFPLRPDLPVGHPGFGYPLPKDASRRQPILDGMFARTDRDKDGFWTREEFLGSISFNRGKPNLAAVRPGGEGDVSESHLVWALHRGIPEVPSPLFYEDRIYMICDGGVLIAVDGSDGRGIYRERIGAGGHYRSSPVVANGHLYLISEEGIVSVVKTGDECDVVQQMALQRPVAATPAIDASAIYIRTESELLAYRGTGG